LAKDYSGYIITQFCRRVEKIRRSELKEYLISFHCC
jgi:hypothetical protein